ncbi:MAG: endonuclease/exonuclease/phosphatase family protein [Bacteroidales bacterium]|jgi:endonuclease/exonuclease/phosphatase family metal-dependent hydrolase|nr:endonuclease/exonuclease/phosphatase family protein [Bacteroidales bacterium]HOL97264.1 endonuclease/exonuclease/phosphatase family protein [Bacteroidales bacterium]HOM35556.1 endonuclease/exonuclease/phosphatase family protein [Bacteroidales bacterium]HPD24436.1 endonuclease/exonuclease/phosphatase family protein [Bacteroidales bacterium]HRS98747.1 endonuclease/exonuclease/phosphatase family protein [Bacteroidales bacterium]
MKKFIKITLIVINIIFSVLLLLSYVSLNIGGIKHLSVIIPFIFIILFVVNVFFLVFWLFINWKYSIITVLPIILGIEYVFMVIPVDSYFSTPQKEPEFKIISYNVANFGLYNWKKNLELRTNMIKLISDEKPDIICLQEAYWHTKNKDFKTISEILNLLNLKYQASFPILRGEDKQDNYGLALLSRFPVINTYKHRFENSYNGFMFADIIIQDDTVRVFNCHLESLKFDESDYETLKHISSENKIDKSLLKKYFRSAIKKQEQVNNIRQVMDTTSYPIFLCGDFNDFPLSNTHVKLSRGLKDTYIRRGKIPGYTWKAAGLKFRIDFIFYNPTKFDCYSHKIIREDLSDHYCISAEFFKNENKENE